VEPPGVKLREARSNQRFLQVNSEVQSLAEEIPANQSRATRVIEKDETYSTAVNAKKFMLFFAIQANSPIRDVENPPG
jgi:hypothetical protein